MFYFTSVCVSVYISSQNILYTNRSICSLGEYIHWMLPMTIFIRMYSLQFCFNNFFFVYILFHRQHVCCAVCIYRICYGYSWYDELLYSICYTLYACTYIDSKHDEPNTSVQRKTEIEICALFIWWHCVYRLHLNGRTVYADIRARWTFSRIKEIRRLSRIIFKTQFRYWQKLCIDFTIFLQLCFAVLFFCLISFFRMRFSGESQRKTVNVTVYV